MSRIDECINIANRVKQLRDEDFVINVSGIEPSVLLRTEAFFAEFSEYEVGELKQSMDGKWFRLHKAVVGGVTFECVEYVEEDDGLGST